ncbi:hypothetical protein FN846DRAFT_356314 [Sphaerosporella brunnea]|uniref:RING-type domain-containing protein n=1 Tax=Sphaerosporella brunnea TaxID=1250544 RepID=A0A5J5EHA1_9PEZI|nr:hypothetical protein FN846DRAFT_356314 [Sphaerosporella brunnea]
MAGSSPMIMSSTSVSASSLDLRALTYLTPVDENLCCPICRSLLIDPQTTKCRHTFCSNCIAGALEISPTCPVDRNPLERGDVSAAPIMISNLVNDLVVLCPNTPLGCTATRARSLIEGHLKDECGFVTVDCPGCEDKILRRDLREECMHTEDHESICPQLTSSCQHCSSEFPRSEISSHELTCDEAIMVCDACSVGCPWSGRRREATAHVLSCAFTYLRPLLHEHASRIAALELENKSLKKRIDILMPTRRDSERSENSSGLLDEQTIQILTEQEHIRSDLERLFAAVADMDMKQSLLTIHMSENMRTREEITMIGAAVNNLRSQLLGLQLLTLRQQSGAGSPSSGSSGTSTRAAVGSILPVRRMNEAIPGNDRVKL